jgi:hypothetical protein
MACSIASVALACALGSTGGLFSHWHRNQGGWVLPDGPGNGWGFPNGNPDGFGWFDNGVFLPLGANRTPEYYFPRYYAVPGEQLVLPSYYNPYISRGQRYIPYAGGGGAHPMGGPPMSSAVLPHNPYLESLGSGPTVPVPRFGGRVDAPPVNAGSTGLNP